MKKILLSCVTCLLALGLVTACDDEVEDVTPEDPNTGVVEPGGDDGEGGDGTGEGGESTTYLFGVEIDGVLSYVTGATQSQGAYRGVLSADVSEAVAISCEQSESTYYLSFDNEGATNWITITSGDHTNLSYATEKSPIYLHTTDGGAEYFGDEEGENFLCYNKTYDCLYASSVSSYLESSPVAGLYTTDGKLVAGGIGKEPEPDPEPVGTMVEQGTGVLGLYQGNKGNYYYFTGEINSNNFGVLSADYSLAAAVTIWKDEVYYYLTIGSGSELKYISCPDTSATAVALISEPYCLQYDEKHDAWLTGNGKRFLATYGTYETMSWAETERYIDDDSEFIAHIYNEEQKLPAPEAGSITISGATSVYVDSTITLTAVIPTGYDSSVEWSIDEEGHATIEESSGLTCVVKGVSEGDATVTVKSTANPEAYATTTISVVPVPTGVTLLGSFDFSSHESGSTQIQTSDALDSYWTGDESIFLGARQHEAVYVGSDGQETYNNNPASLKFGTSTANGLLELKFALGTSVTEVHVTAHSWSTSTATDLTINGVTKQASITGTAEELVYEIADDLTYLVTMEASARLSITSLEIYGTMNNSYEEVTSLTLTPDTEDAIAIGDTTNITVIWEPATTIFDIDVLEWTSSLESVATVTSTVNGASVHAYAAGETEITAAYSDSIVGKCTISVHALEEEGLYGMYDFSKITYSTRAVTSSSALSTDQLKTDLSTAWTGAGNPENSNPLSSVDTATNIYDYNSSSGWKSGQDDYDGYLKTGTGSNNGEMKITLTIDIVKVVISCHSWTANASSPDTVSVNDSATQNASISDSYEDLTFEITSSKELDFVFAKRVFIGSIKLYTE